MIVLGLTIWIPEPARCYLHTSLRNPGLASFTASFDHGQLLPLVKNTLPEMLPPLHVPLINMLPVEPVVNLFVKDDESIL